MAKEQSFDVVSSIDVQEVDNAFQQTKKEIANRYDLKNTGSSIALDKGALTITILAPSEFTAKQIIDVLSTKLVKRGVDLKAVKWGDATPAAGAKVRQVATLVSGIDKDTAGKINKDIKALKLKVKVQIEGDKLRVSSASRDTLQEVIAFLKEKDYGQPLQYVNYR
ncbi:MAG: YajQ family cyclic di-GMP-binding protein [Eggerthellaceae bacterium]|nr:YajQ family cyclic di-GMP-binding protein [Eggerthellaceae bacterium]